MDKNLKNLFGRGPFPFLLDSSQGHMNVYSSSRMVIIATRLPKHDPKYIPEVLFCMARVLAADGNKEQAGFTLEKLIEKYSSSPYAALAANEIKTINE